MNYEINVSKKGQHVFATAERSLESKNEAVSLYIDFIARFPKEEGFLVELYLIEKARRQMEVILPKDEEGE